jgi:hypothetical protein
MELVKKNRRLLNINRQRANFYPRSEKSILFAIGASIALPMVDTLVNIILNVKYLDSFVTLGIYYGSLLMALYYARRRFRSEMLGVPVLVIGMWLLSFFVFTDNRPFLIDQVFLPLMTSGLPLFIITLAVKDYRRLYNVIRIASIASIVSALGFVLLQYYGKYEISYMSFSYSMVLPVMLMLIFSFENKRRLDLLIALLGVIIVFVMGARAPMFGLLCGSFFYFLINLKLNFKNVILMFIFFILIFYLAINFNSVIHFLNNSLQKRNISSRTVNLLQTDKIEGLSGREVIYDKGILGTKSLFTGNGMAGDRVILGGTYAHNLFLELLLEYGLILGSIFIIILMQYLVRSLFVKNKGVLYYFFFAIFFTTGFIKLQVSFSYLLEPTFFIMLALAILLTTNRKKIKRKPI